MIINAQQITNVAVIGLGLTGQSCVRFLLQQGITPTLYDTRPNLDLAPITEQFGALNVTLGPLDNSRFEQYQMVLVSPGIAISHPSIAAAKKAGCLIWGDIELFAHFVKAPVIAITGSNGKTTVTSLLGEMAINAGIKTAVGGNIGVPVLDLVADQSIELFILELSSFQLETTSDLALVAATILNVSDDHLDRYDGFAQYAQAKQQIYLRSETAVVNRQDPLTVPSTNIAQISFGLDAPAAGHYGLKDGGLYHGDRLLIATTEIAMIGRHNYLNALAALALGSQAGIALPAMLDTLTTFGGLEHRCQQISSKGQVRWLNDSKATNVGATLAALEGLADHQGQLIVIAGGDAKGADLSPLKQPFAQYVDQLFVIGVDKQPLCDIYPQAICCDDLTAAVAGAAKICQAGDIVLLSPACSSLDMFRNYIERGLCFVAAVEAL